MVFTVLKVTEQIKMIKIDGVECRIIIIIIIIMIYIYKAQNTITEKVSLRTSK